MVSTVDLPATLLDAAGIGVPEPSESEVGRVIRTRRWKYFVTDPAAKTRRVPSKRWRRTQARIGTLHVQSASIRRDVLHKAPPHSPSSTR